MGALCADYAFAVVFVVGFLVDLAGAFLDGFLAEEAELFDFGLALDAFVVVSSTTSGDFVEAFATFSYLSSRTGLSI